MYLLAELGRVARKVSPGVAADAATERRGECLGFGFGAIECECECVGKRRRERFGECGTVGFGFRETFADGVGRREHEGDGNGVAERECGSFAVGDDRFA